MKGIRYFLYKTTEQFRWQYFSWKRMCLLSLFLFLFFIGWRFFFQENAAQEFTFPRLTRHIILAIFMGFIYSFSKKPESE